MPERNFKSDRIYLLLFFSTYLYSEYSEFTFCLLKSIDMKIMLKGNSENVRKFLLIFKYLHRELISMKIMLEGNFESDRKFFLYFKYFHTEFEFTLCLLKTIDMKITLERNFENERKYFYFLNICIKNLNSRSTFKTHIY